MKSVSPFKPHFILSPSWPIPGKAETISPCAPLQVLEGNSNHLGLEQGISP